MSARPRVCSAPVSHLIPCPVCGETLRWTRNGLGGYPVDCARGHAASTPSEQWERLRRETVISEVQRFLAADRPPDCRKHEWHVIERCWGITMLACGRCDGVAVEENTGSTPDTREP